MMSFTNLTDDIKVHILKFAEQYKGGISRSLQQYLSQIRNDIIYEEVSINTINNIATHAVFNDDKDLILKILTKYPFSMKTHHIISNKLILNERYDIMKEIRFNNVNSDKNFDIKCHWNTNTCNQVAYSGNLKMFKWMCDNEIQGEFICKPNTITIEFALQGIIEKIYSTKESRIDIIDTYEHWDIIRFINPQNHAYTLNIYLAAAQYSGDYNIRHHLICSIYNILDSTSPYFKQNPLVSIPICQKCAKHGYIETLEWFEEEGGFQAHEVEYIIAAAAIGNQISIITKYIEKYNYKISCKVMLNYLQIYMTKQPYKTYDLNNIIMIYDMIIMPSYVDNKEKWFVTNCKRGITRSYEKAAITGNLDVIIWLSKTKGLVVNLYKTKISDYAASKGHLHIVKWLYNNYKKSLHITKMYDEATKNNHVCIINFLNSIVPKNKQPTINIFRIACEYGHIDILKMISLTEKQKRNISILECGTLAVRNGNLNILEWIMENVVVSVSDLQNEIDNAAQYLEIILIAFNDASKKWHDIQNKTIDIQIRFIPSYWNIYMEEFKRHSDLNTLLLAIEKKLTGK